MITRRAFAALSLTALSFLAACGGSGKPSVEASADEKNNPAVDLNDLVSSSVTKATKADTSRFSVAMSMPGPDGQAMNVNATGVMDSSIPLMGMTMDLGAMAPGAGGTMEALFDGSAIYYKFPAAFGLGGKPWVKMDLKSLSKVSGLDLEGVMEQFEQSDPKANLGMLVGASDVTEVGREDVRGVSTRHLKMTVDINKAVENAPANVKETVAKVAESMGTSTFPAEVWIGDDELPYKLKYSMTAAGQPVEMTMELFDYGTDVNVEIPPADQTMDFAEFLGRTAGAAGS